MNYDMITEMYEATRYAKEIHKKNEKLQSELGIKGKSVLADNARVALKMLKKENRKKYMDASDLSTKDTIQMGQHPAMTKEFSKKYGPTIAKHQKAYGRYNY